jgi:hypothetical protein
MELQKSMSKNELDEVLGVSEHDEELTKSLNLDQAQARSAALSKRNAPSEKGAVQFPEMQIQQDLGQKDTADLKRAQATEAETLRQEIALLRSRQAAKDEADLKTLQEVISIAEHTQAELDKVLKEKDAEVGERAKAENQIEALRQTIMQKDEILKAYETNLRATLHGDHEN